MRAENARYTKSLGRVPDVFGALTHYYRIEVARATQNQLLVVAVGEGRRNAVAEASALVGDRVAIDERFQVRTNFPLPHPPRDYLHTVARMVMNRIFANQFRMPKRSELELWEGVFKGYFRYEVKPVSNGGRTIVAVGLGAPVQDDIIEMQPGANVYEWVYNHRKSSWIENEIYGNLEKIYLAERIYQDHVGSYSPTLKGLLPIWNDLSTLTIDQSPLVIQEFQLDPTFGFHAEVAERSSPGSASDRAPSSVRALSVNGYGQVSEVSSIENIVNQFEQARNKIFTHGKAESVKSDEPLLIDVVEPEK